MVSLRLQFFTFLNMILVGMVIGIGFDFYRVLRSKVNPLQIFTILFDIVFSLLSAIIIFITLFYSNGGAARGYVFIGVFTGVIIYYLTISNFMIKVLTKLANIIYWIYTKAKKIIIWIYNKSKLIMIKIRRWIKQWGEK
ncbi:spore cortex biosynthesis protein YabQ [Halobacteroides halobius DSM 5150]|uniref:Spore cortex biosynthesis protein YabQ n=1 Tax=Halobacteroides halobius (strain ATCC 35273 / DSM 5150 / MD-1) TaxID=748449 RepID=L0K549_HALHC|nr:spore cortex biosynthesis protein YabQ [Halobacteroides halobius]AGB40141.1 spore cortex biosynthesis protein YabQ [Halobacteroides halobius DSM 5150]